MSVSKYCLGVAALLDVRANPLAPGAAPLLQRTVRNACHLISRIHGILPKSATTPK
ncbi:hypothetical protein ACFSTC_11160 [Nonomuraea ferruginea]